MPLISVIIPVYNMERYLDRCLSSIMIQEDISFEVLIINDGSTDRSKELCETWAKQHTNIKLYNKENGGVASARNHGIQKAQGEYLFFIDPDDYIKPNTLKDNFTIAKQGGYDMVIFGYSKISLTKSGSQIADSQLNDMVLESQTEIIEKLTTILNDGGRFSVWNKFFKRDIIVNNAVMFPNFKRGQDIAFTLETFKYVKTIAVNSEKYYVQEAFYENAKSSPDAIEIHIYCIDKFYTLFENWMNIPQNKAYYTKLFILWFCHVIPNSIIRNNNLTHKEKFQKIAELLEHPKVRIHVSNISKNDIRGIDFKVLFILFKKQRSLFFYIISLLKAFAIQRLNVEYFRKRLSKIR